MNRQFNPTSPLLRSLFAIAAVFTTLLTVAGIDGLATYSSADAQLASTTTVVARR